SCLFFLCFFFNAIATTQFSTLSLHDALPISGGADGTHRDLPPTCGAGRDEIQRERGYRRVARSSRSGHERYRAMGRVDQIGEQRSEEHTSELQSLAYLVCRLLLEKKKKKKTK